MSRQKHYLPEDKRLPLCGTKHAQITTIWAQVTCKKCLKLGGQG